MKSFEADRLLNAALAVAGPFSPSGECSAGSVAAAILTAAGDIFTGICIDTRCSLGFCAEHAAIAEMLKHRQSRIVAIAAVRADGAVLPPCGRCRELIRQVDPANLATRVVLPGTIVGLDELLPYSGPAQTLADPA